MTKDLIIQTIALLNITEYKTEVLKEKRDDCVKALKEQLGLCDVVKSFYCFEESMNMQLKCDSECDYCKSIKIEQ